MPQRDVILLLIAALALLATPARALTPESARFRALGLAQGLSQPSVKAMAQDRHGFLWLGTQTGLNRYDGFEVRTFYHQRGVADSLPHNSVSALLLDPAGDLWVGTDGGGLARYVQSRERFEVWRARPDDAAALPSDSINALLVDALGDLWIGSEAGLTRRAALDGALQTFATGATERARVRALAQDADGALWLGTVGGLLRFDPRSGAVERPLLAEALAAVAQRPVRALRLGSAGQLWVGTDQGLLRLDRGGGGEVWRAGGEPGRSLGNDVIGALLEDGEGRLWIGHETGVDLLQRDHAGSRVMAFRHQRQAPQSLGSGRVASLLQDRDGGLWFGTWSGGASLLSPYSRRVLSFTPDTPATAALPEPEITALAVQEPATLWLGGRGGLYSFDVAQRRLTLFPALLGRRIYGLAVEPDGLVLGGERGLSRFDPRRGELTEVPWQGGGGAQVNYLRADGERLWVGTRDPSLVMVDARSLQPLARFEVDGLVRFIAAYDERTLLVGTSHGLFWHDRRSGELRHAHRADPSRDDALRTSAVSSFLRARDGRQWLASATGGLHEILLAPGADPASARFRVYSRGQGPDADTLSSILEDGRGQLWLSSSRGVVRFDPASGGFTSYLSADGSLEAGYYADVRAQFGAGMMAFGGLEGFTLLDPGAVVELPPPPRPMLIELELDNRPQSPGPQAALPAPLYQLDQLTLAAAQARSLGLRFSAPDFLAGPQLRFSYRLEGFDRDWIEAESGRRAVTYTNLAAGDYRFRLRAVNQDGRFSREEAQLALRILPPWWQTLWARALGLLLLLGIALAWHGLRLRGLEAQRRQLQQQVAQRTEQLSSSNRALSDALDALRSTQRSLVEQEKMASLGGLVAGVAHEINTPVGVALTAASHLNDLAGEAMQRLAAGKLTQGDMHRFRDALQEGFPLVLGSLQRAHSLVASFKQVAADQSGEQRRVFDLATFLDEARLSLAPSHRLTAHQLSVRCADSCALDTYPGALFQIVANLVNNSLLHAFAPDQAGQMSLEAECEPDGNTVRLRYRDDGVGMSAEVAARAFEPFFTTRRGKGGSGLGLHVCYNYVTQLLGGSIELRSVPGAGVTVAMRIPRVAPRRAAAGG